jgi:CHASE2 domain-containing sensor protein/signal transduction histidine kinase
MNVIKSLLKHSVIREWLAIVLVLALIILGAVRWGWFDRIDRTLYDKALSVWQRPAQDDIVIIGVDNSSLEQLGRWPWSRVLHATLVNKLTQAKVKAIALDVIFTEADATDPSRDQLLGDALKANGHVVVPLIQRVSEGALLGEQRPVDSIAAGAASIGYIGSHFDTDGVVRSAFLMGGFREARNPLLAVALLRLTDPEKAAALDLVPTSALAAEKVEGAQKPGWVIQNQYQIPFVGPPGSFKHISYIDVLRGDFPLADLKDKTVFVGLTATSMADEFPTPVSGLGRAMPGIEIHANVYQGLRESIHLSSTSRLQVALISFGLTLALMVTYLWLGPRRSLLLTVASIALTGVLSVLLFRWGSVWISPVVAVFAMALAFPLWSWRKLEATQRYFDGELARFNQEPSVVSLETARSLAPQQQRVFVPDVIEQRIDAVRDAGERLRNLNRFIADSLESLPEAALVTDFSGRVLLANTSANRLLGRKQGSTSQPIERRDLFDLLQEYQHGASGKWRTLWDDVIKENRTISVEAKGPDEMEFLVQIAPSVSHDGKTTGAIVTMTDISPLRESERRRDEALRFLSHDMRSPQASILTMLEMYKEDPESIPTPKLVDRIGKYSRRTLTLADDFLRLAKAERSKPTDFEILDIGELLRDASEEAWSLATGKGIKVESIVPAEEAWVSGERDLLTRVLMNLLSNAIKYSPRDTTITCRLRRDEEEKAPFWAIDIADQGYGISDENMNKLFSRFVRIHQEGQPEEEGIGLGLVFVKTVVTRHNGRISVKSKVSQALLDGQKVSANATGETDHGTTFTVHLPAQDAPKD